MPSGGLEAQRHEAQRSIWDGIAVKLELVDTYTFAVSGASELRTHYKIS